jgi:hypothetical protein
VYWDKARINAPRYRGYVTLFKLDRRSSVTVYRPDCAVCVTYVSCMRSEQKSRKMAASFGKAYTGRKFNR